MVSRIGLRRAPARSFSRIDRATAPRLECLESRLLYAATTFTVDPAASSLRLSGQVAGELNLEEQRKNSLTAAYEGVILADVNADSIAFLGGSDVVAKTRGKFNPGNAPGNYAGKGETGGFLSVRVGDAVVRELRVDLTSGALVLASGSFASNGVTFAATAGRLDYDLRVGNDGTVSLANRTATNASATPATITGSGADLTLTIPVDLSYNDSSAQLRLRGQLVARSGAGGGTVAEPNKARVGDGAARSVSFTDADGSTGVVALRGGTADLQFENATGQTNKKGVIVVSGTNVRLLGITATGTTAASKLLIRGAGGADGAVDVPALTADGALNSLGGLGVNLTGAATVGGPVNKTTFTRMTNATLTAPSIRNMKVVGDVVGSNVSLTGGFVPGGLTLGKFIGGTVSGSRISSGGNIGAFKATTLVNSEVFAGVAGADRFPNDATDLPSEAGIAKIAVGTFDNSVVAARNLGNLKLGVIDTDNAATPFGVTAHAIAGLQATNAAGQRLRLTRLTDPAVLAATLTAQGFTPGDFAVRLV